MACKKDHVEADKVVEGLGISQGSFERHKCASCAYEQGLENGECLKSGQGQVLSFNLQEFISNLNESQAGKRRHRSAIEAYTLGFLHGLSGVKNHSAIKSKMDLALKMRQYGLALTARGVMNIIMSDLNEDKNDAKQFEHSQAIVNIANGFEILIKARIVEEHPLLVFEQLPKQGKIQDGDIKFEDLLEHGKTVMYSELPERLWSATGYKLENEELFVKFGKIRNQIIHFAVPNNVSMDKQALTFAFKSVEKAVNTWWDTTILKYMGEGSEDIYRLVFERLRQLKLPINYRLNANGDLEKKI